MSNPQLRGRRVNRHGRGTDGSRRDACTRRAPWLLIAASALTLAVIAALGGWGSYALWNDQAVFHSAPLKAGNLDLVRTGEVSWQQVTPGVSNPASGTLGIPNGNGGTSGTGTPSGTTGTASDTFATMPGDVIEFDYPFEIQATGDNLEASVSVSFASGQAPNGQVAVSFHINAGGQQIAPASGEAQFGDTVTLPAIDGVSGSAGGAGSGSGTHAFTLVMTAKVLGNYQWESGPSSNFLTTWTAASFDVVALQVRSAGATPSTSARVAPSAALTVAPNTSSSATTGGGA